jgi:lysozyme family protein
MAVKLTDDLRAEYGKLFGKMVIREEHTDEIAAIYRRLQTGERPEDYAFVEEQIGVPRRRHHPQPRGRPAHGYASA